VQLFPWLDGHAAAAERTGLPLMRALALDFPRDPRAWAIHDSYQLGAGLLVAPVLGEGATSRTVYLPEGTWVSLATGEKLDGGREVTVEAPMTEVPLFLRAGTCLPRLPARVETLLPASPPVVDLEDVANERVLLLVPGGDSAFTERDGTAYRVEASGGGELSEGGAALSACSGPTERGCVDRSAARPVVRMATQGPLRFPGGRLTVTGPARALDVELLGL
jgi:alpha-D-xyloside xylohydrolase